MGFICLNWYCVAGEEGEEESKDLTGHIYDPQTAKLEDIACPANLTSLKEEEVNTLHSIIIKLVFSTRYLILLMTQLDLFLRLNPRESSLLLLLCVVFFNDCVL